MAGPLIGAATRDLLYDWSLLLQVTGRLGAADSISAPLQALTLPSPAPVEGEVCLWAIDELASATVVAVAPAEGRPARAQVGTRRALSDLPFTGPALADPMVPLLIADIPDDPRIERSSESGIGTIDRERGKGVLAAALQGARDRRARVTILDITGVPAIDEQAAAALTRTAQALRLLGVEAVLSGVRPAVAQALLALDTPLAGIVTCGSLQAGIEYALRRLGKRG